MEWFTFSEGFNGNKFYEKFKDSAFLKEQKNLRTILLRSDELQRRYETMEPGVSLGIKGMSLKTNMPLVIKKSKFLDESDVDQDSFTLRRLLGLVAVYVHNNFEKSQWEHFYCVESERCGLIPETGNLHYNMGYAATKPPYYSAVPGAEYFYDQFGYYPFLFALRRFQQNQISEEMLLVIANTRNNVTMKSLVMHCGSDASNAANAATQCGFNLYEAIRKAPQDIKCFFRNNMY